MNQINDFYLGVGIKLPIELISGRVQLTSTGSESVQQSIKDILSTPIGTRFFYPEYGSRINELMFEPNDNVLETLMLSLVDEALQFEKRAKLVKIEYTYHDEEIRMRIYYRNLPSNEIDSFVYPFYRKLKY